MKHVADLQRTFDRVAVVSLARRTGRWTEFVNRLPSDWPFRPPLRFEAVDGSQCQMPSWWKGVNGAWGCYQSHLQIVEDCLKQNIESVLILEDDAVFLDGFGRDVRHFFASLPDDWEFLYLGGQHIHMHDAVPQRVNDWVYKPYNVNRTHAYALRGRKMLQRVAEHLRDSANWRVHHVDHRLGELHERMDGGLYCPKRWLVAQSGGKSDIAIGKNLGERAFRSAESLYASIVDRRLCAVLGPYSSGTSAVAGLLHHLGVSMGAKFGKPDATNDRGTFEAVTLGNACRRCFDEPWLTESLDKEKRSRILRVWAAERCDDVRSLERPMNVIGGKHPLLCLMGPELDAAWNRPALVIVDRDRDEIVNSLSKRNWGWPIDAICTLTDQLIVSRENYIASRPFNFLRFDFRELVSNPSRIADELCQFPRNRT